MLKLLLTRHKIVKMPYYAVAKGRNTGIYNSWSECQNQVKGYSGATFKKFDSMSGANEFVSNNGGHGSSSYSSYGSGPSSSHSSYGSSDYYYGSTSRNDGGVKRDSEGYAQVYTDGACSSNGQEGARAGYGVYWGDNHRFNRSQPVTGRATNNAGEIQAATEAMRTARENGYTKVAINTDSKFLKDSATKWMSGWKENGWKTASGEPVKNQADFKEMDRAQKGLDVKWNYVKAHDGSHGNEMADKLAKAGAAKYK